MFVGKGLISGTPSLSAIPTAIDSLTVSVCWLIERKEKSCYWTTTVIFITTTNAISFTKYDNGYRNKFMGNYARKKVFILWIRQNKNLHFSLSFISDENDRLFTLNTRSKSHQIDICAIKELSNAFCDAGFTTTSPDWIPRAMDTSSTNSSVAWIYFSRSEWMYSFRIDLTVSLLD